MPRHGVPGAPGAADLEAALRRLTPAEVISRRACLSTGSGYNFDYDGGIIHSPPNFLPIGCRTPDSIMSTGSGSSGNTSGFSGNSATSWRLPEKLQIVKPLEGSQTLRHWSKLATPTLGGLLEERPGVRTRGGRALEDLGLETFTLADLEEDEEYANPGKLFQDTGSIYTFTNSTVLHPEDNTSVTASVMGSRVATAPNSAINSGMNTPRTLSRRNSTSTFSTTLGLAKMLNERGIKAVTPSCAGTPSSEKNFTPTATPYNSPDGSPPASRSSSPVPYNCQSSGLSFGIFSSGAELLKRTFSGETAPGPTPTPTPTTTPTSTPMARKKRTTKPALSRSEKKALSGIRLVEKLERIGIDTIMAATTAGSTLSPLALQGAIYSRRNESPMQQLTFLKSSMSTEKLGSNCSSISGGSSSKSMRDDEAQLGYHARSGAAARAAQNRARRAGSAGTTRPDLGQVRGAASTVASELPVTKESATQSALGTISSLLFGRKGGLL